MKNYIEHTFRKQKSDRQLQFSKNNEWCCFNTGLMTTHYEYIFALFEKNKKTPSKSPFDLKGFFKQSDRNLAGKFPDVNFPEPPNYFKDPSLLIFNPTLEIEPQYEHIFGDNFLRFPTQLHAYGEAVLRKLVIGAIDETKKRLRANYKLAVPQYFNGQIQLLIPIFLTEGSEIADLALPVYLQSFSSKRYSARTCLTIPMAYNNARLIVKPCSEWLQP